MKRGITFIEVLISTVIVGIILSGMLLCLNFAYKYTRHNANTTMALNYAQALMEEIKNVGYRELDNYDEYSDTVLLYQEEGVNIVATRNVKLDGEDDEPFRKIKVTVAWDWLGKHYTEEINTLRYNYE